MPIRQCRNRARCLHTLSFVRYLVRIVTIVASCFVVCGWSSPSGADNTARVQEVRQHLEALSGTLLGSEPCSGESCAVSRDEQSLSSALLVYLRQEPHETTQQHEQGTHNSRKSVMSSWPCATSPRMRQIDEGVNEYKGVMWHMAVSLRSCGVSGLPDVWPKDEVEWSSMSLHMLSAIDALSKVRSDNVSLICPPPVLDASKTGTTMENDATADVDGNTDVESDNQTSRSNSLVRRCPRCAYAVAADGRAQRELWKLNRNLLASKDLLPSGDLGDAVGSDYSLGRVDDVKEAGCIASERKSEKQLEAAWSSGVASALVAAADLFHCGACQLDGLARFLRACIDTATDSRLAVAVGALIVVKCATHTPDIVSSERLLRNIRTLEKALWRGVGFPSLHDAAAEHLLDVRRAGRLEGLILKDLAIPLCSSDSGPIDNVTWSYSRSSEFPRDARYASIWSYEREALQRWAPKGRGYRGDPLQLAVAYLNLAEAVEEPLEAAVSLCNAALWLKETKQDFERGHHQWAAEYISQDSTKHSHLNQALQIAIEQVVGTAHTVAASLTAPGAQFLVFKMCDYAGGLQSGHAARKDRVLHPAPPEKLFALAKQNPFWSPPFALVADAVELGAIAARLHAAYILRMNTLDPDALHADPKDAAAVELSLYETALVENRMQDASMLRSQAMGAMFRLSGQDASWQAVQRTMQKAFFNKRRRKHSFGETLSSLEPHVVYQDSFMKLTGVRIDLDTGANSLILERPRIQAPQGYHLVSVSAATIVAMIKTGRYDAPSLELDTPSLSSALKDGIAIARPPFQRIAASLTVGETVLKLHLMRAVLALQRLASGGAELSSRPPFVLSECSGTVCKKMPSKVLAAGRIASATPMLRKGSGLKITCGEVSYSGWESAPGTLDIRFDVPNLDVVVNEPGTEGPIRQFAAAMFDHLNGAMEPWSGLAPMRQLCLLRAAAVLLDRDRADILPALVRSRQGSDHSATSLGGYGGALPRSVHAHQSEWLEKMMEVHIWLLRHLGHSNLDPGRCFDGVFTFGKCCSISEYASSCWQPGFSEARCCLSPATAEMDSKYVELAAKRLAAFTCSESLPSNLLNAVGAWLRRPTGRDINAQKSLSGRVADLLEDEAKPCGIGRPKVQESHEQDQLNADTSADGQKEELVPGRGFDHLPHLGIILEPILQAKPGHARELPDSMQVLRTEDLSQAAQHSELRSQFIRMASVFPHLRALRGLSSRLSNLYRRSVAADGVNDDAGAPESQDGSVGSCCVNEQMWTLLQPQDVSRVAVGHLLRIRSSRVVETLQVSGVLQVAHAQGSSQLLHRVRNTRTAAMSYYNLSQPGLMVTYAAGMEQCTKPQEICSNKEHSRTSSWPDCIRQGETIRGMESAGIFVNVVGFGINSGCFRDDCTHTDHFESSSPAACAKICMSIRACKWWSYWVSAASGTCWLRRHDRHRLPMMNGLSAASDCTPPVGSHSSSLGRPGAPANDNSGRRKGEPTIFELAQGQWGIGPRHPFHQWDLVKVLETYGHSTPSELEVKEKSPLQQSALRFARKAQRLRAAGYSLATL